MRLDFNKSLAALLSLALAAPGPAFAGQANRALPTAPKLQASVVLPQISALPVAAIPSVVTPAPNVLMPVLAAQDPVQAVIPKVFEASTLDAAAIALPQGPVPMSGAENLHRSSLLQHHHGHSHDAGGPGGPPRDPKKEISALKKALLASGAFVGIELAGGLLLDSLALRADALHLTADWALNALALGAMLLAHRPGASERWKKTEPYVGLFSSAVIGYTAFEIAAEALERMHEPLGFSAPAVILLALCGLAANGLSTAILYKHRDGGLGVRSVFLHALTDAAGSLAVAVSSALIWAFGWQWADPAASALIVLLISKTAFDLGRQSWKALRAGKTSRP